MAQISDKISGLFTVKLAGLMKEDWQQFNSGEWILEIHFEKVRRANAHDNGYEDSLAARNIRMIENGKLACDKPQLEITLPAEIICQPGQFRMTAMFRISHPSDLFYSFLSFSELGYVQFINEN